MVLTPGIAAVPPVLTDQSDAVNATVLPPGATRQLIAYYQFGWVGVRLDRGAGGMPGLQHHLAVDHSAGGVSRLIRRGLVQILDPGT